MSRIRVPVKMPGLHRPITVEPTEAHVTVRLGGRVDAIEVLTDG